MVLHSGAPFETGRGGWSAVQSGIDGYGVVTRLPWKADGLALTFAFGLIK